MGGWSVFVTCCVWAILLLALFGDSLASAPEFDPYKVLGVSRHDSQAEIKKAYKRLAREWHPDKNKSPGAQDMFIKITKSYEILSNEERRANYDRFGQMDENQNFARAPQGFRHYQDSFYFDESFFHFPRTSRDFTDSKHHLHYNQYISEVLPDSFKRPYLIKITSEWCFTCIHIEPVWKDTVLDLEPLGVGIGVVVIGYERQLANHLGAHRTPSILGLINGKVTFFHYAVVREHLRQFVESLLPQKLVEKVCTQPRFFSKVYCVLLVTGEGEQFVSVNEAFFDFASSNTKEVLRFAYVYQRQQQPLCDTLLKKEDTTPPQVILLERRSATGRVLYRTVTGGWNGSDDDKHRLHEQLEILQRDPSHLTHDAMLPELNNEFASMFLIHWINTAYDYLAQFYFDLLYSNWREMMPVLSLIFSALFILFGTVIIQAFSDAGEDKPAKQKATDPPKTLVSCYSRPPKKNFVEVTELTDITYMSNLVRLKPGHINVVLILTDASKQVLLRKFAKEVYSFSGSQTLHYSFLNVDKHSQWMDSLMESAPDARPSDCLDEEEDSTSNKSDYTGHVLALNGHKKYFCIFRPVFTGEEAECSRWSDEDAATAGPSKATRSRSSSRQKATTLEIHHKLDRLSLWMERLMEGTLPRHYVLAWPGLDTITPQK
uniref:DnaJ (Hsp40) homolog, subfamily C, member 16 like n=1 Tax=Sinocyclocheilus anshuiensis TaxID=1608454 RepID=A0A671NFL6_9TELE